MENKYKGECVNSNPVVRLYKLPEGEGLHINLNEQRLANELCDTWITTEGQDYPAHKRVLAARSQYFKARFSSPFSDSSEARCQLPQIPGSIINTVLEFMYLGQITINRENVEHLLSAADYLLMSDLKDFCLSLLKVEMDIEIGISTNLIETYRLVSAYGTEDMTSTALKVIRENIHWICQEKAVLKAPYSLFSVLVKDNSFVSVREQDKFELIVRWISHDLSMREQYFLELFKLIDAALFPVRYLSRVVLQDQLVKKHLDAKSLQNLLKKSKRKPPAQCDMIILGGGPKHCTGSKLIAYLVQEDEWLDLDFEELHQFKHFQHGCLKNKLYILGEKPNDPIRWSRFVEYDLITKTTKTLPSPPSHIFSSDGIDFDYVELLGHGDCMYVLVDSFIFCQYNTQTNSWKVRQQVSHCNCDCFGMGHLALIGGGKNIYAYRFSDFAFHKYSIDKDEWQELGCPLQMDPYELPHERHYIQIYQYPFIANDDSIIIQDPIGLWGLHYDVQLNLWTELRDKDKDQKVPREVFWGGSAHYVGSQVYLMSTACDLNLSSDVNRNLVLPVRFHPDKGTYKLLKPSTHGFHFCLGDYQMSSHVELSTPAESLYDIYPSLD